MFTRASNKVKRVEEKKEQTITTLTNVNGEITLLEMQKIMVCLGREVERTDCQQWPALRQLLLY